MRHATRHNGRRVKAVVWQVRRRKAVFFDRDGTLVRYVREPVKSAHIRLVKDAPEVTRRLHAAGYRCIVLTNQPVVGEGRISKRQADALNALFVKKMRERGGVIDAVYMCPHRYDHARPCHCRKPALGMVWEAARRFRLDIPRSFMVGDFVRDVQTGKNAGMRTILVRRKGKDGSRAFFNAVPDRTVSSLRSVPPLILRRWL